MVGEFSGAALNSDTLMAASSGARSAENGAAA
jgi:hypothetical protein